MRSFWIPILLSLLLHVLFIGLFGFLVNNMLSSCHFVEYLAAFISPSESESHLIERKRNSAPQSSGFLMTTSTIQAKKKEQDRPDATPPSQTDHPAEEAWASFLKEGEARVTLLRQNADKDIVVERSNAFAEPAIPPFRIGKSAFGGRDPVADGIYKRNIGAQPFVMNLTPVAEIEKKTVRPPSLDFVPTNIQLSCLSRLMDEDSLTDTQLYPLLGGTVNTTFENFRREMDYLTEKGLVTRQKVSPSQIFSFFGIPIEMSAKNRRNPEFLYKPHIDRKSLLIFLEARLYDVNEQFSLNPADSTRIQAIRTLKEKLALIRPMPD